MAKILGIKHSTGTYQGTQYSNYLLFEELKDQKIIGIGVVVHKVKDKLFNEFIKQYGLSADKLIGQNVYISYNRYGQVDKLSM